MLIYQDQELVQKSWREEEMSIDTCKGCCSYVDTDWDGDAYCLTFEDGTEYQLNHCMCENCRGHTTSHFSTAAEYSQHLKENHNGNAITGN